MFEKATDKPKLPLLPSLPSQEIQTTDMLAGQTELPSLNLLTLLK